MTPDGLPVIGRLGRLAEDLLTLASVEGGGLDRAAGLSYHQIAMAAANLDAWDATGGTPIDVLPELDPPQVARHEAGLAAALAALGL